MTLPSPVLVPFELLPDGDSQYDAFAGVSWRFSKSLGLTRIHRAGDDIRMELPGGGTGSLVRDNGAPDRLRVDVAVAQADPTTVTGVVARIADGIEVRAPDGRTIKVTRQRDHVAIGVKGFGVKDAVGVYLRPRP